MDLDTYLRRFDAYTQAIGATPAEIPHLLINALDEETLQYIERHLVDNITLPELLAVLRREMGISRLNREDFKAKLRKTLRNRNEDVRSFYSKLWNLAKRAWPDNAEVRNSNLRDTFIANFQDSSISARLRERPELDNEGLLDLAVTLVNCKNASLSRQSEVNASFGPPSAFDQALEVNPPVRSLPTQSLEQKLDQVIGLLANVNMPAQNSQLPSNQYATASNDHQNAGQYHYRGDRRSAGLSNFSRGFNQNRNHGYYSNNYRRDYAPSQGQRFHYNQGQNRYQRDNFSPRVRGSWGRPNNFYPRGRNF